MGICCNCEWMPKRNNVTKSPLFQRARQAERNDRTRTKVNQTAKGIAPKRTLAIPAAANEITQQLHRKTLALRSEDQNASSLSRKRPEISA